MQRDFLSDLIQLNFPSLQYVVFSVRASVSAH